MAPKRKGAEQEDLTAREKKKVKVAAARTIAVQSASSRPQQNAKAGPSRVGIVNSMDGLPTALDVEKFAEARAFEISAMEDAMKNSSASSTSRAWQALPRHLRRRAASHDVRRVPLRLREKARAEMDPVSKKAAKHRIPKLGKAKRLKRTEILQQRQVDKTWLETHLWHAKRMKMESMWGYRLAIHPTEKSFRPSHRASVHGSILHDASYFATIELKGSEDMLKTILEWCCDPQGAGPGSKRYTSGARALDTFLYRYRTYPFGMICPITVMWRPLNAPSEKDSRPSDKEKSDPTNSSTAPAGGANKGKEKAANTSPDRVVWVRVHPSTFDTCITILQSSASAALAEAKRQAAEGTEEVEVEIADLRGQINAFEIMGPKSNQVLKGALSPIHQNDENTQFSKFWDSLSDVQSSGQLARGMIIGFMVYDPRLKFPPKNAKVESCISPHTAPGMSVFPSAGLAATEIWDDDLRTKLAKPHYKKKELDERRSKNLVPGTALKPQRQDDRIPVLLIQRSLENSNSKAQGIHGWILLIPAGWSMAFLPSLIYTGTRIGGQRERQSQAFEAGVPYFPRDLPCSDGYDAYARAREEEEQETWNKKPPAKRVNFKKLGTRSPWRADWETVLGLKAAALLNHEGLVTTQRESPPNTEDLPMWLLRGSETRTVLESISKMFNPGAGLLQVMNQLRMKRGFDALGSTYKSDNLFQAALIGVRVNMCRRGAPQDLAMIYALDSSESRQWERLIHQKPYNDSEEESDAEKELSLKKPSPDAIIGYVTTGHFSLSQGAGYATGAVALSKLLKLAERGSGFGTGRKKFSLLVKIRNRDGQQCRAARIELLDDSD